MIGKRASLFVRIPFGYGQLLLLLLSMPFASCERRHQVERITVRGSDTEVNLVLQLAEAYMARDPEVSLSIAGGGSGVGIAALLNGKTDIANSSRAVSAAELAFAQKRGIQIVQTAFAADALVLITHPAIGVERLTMAQLGDIFSGKIRDWAAVGGKPGRISLYGRQSNSGTHLYFREKVLGCDFSPALKQMNGTAQIVEAIQRDAGGIGYVGLGYVLQGDGAQRKGLRVLAIQADSTSTAVSPLDAGRVRNGDYPLLRPLYQLTNGVPTGKILDFFRFEASPEGRQIIADNGYLPLSTEPQTPADTALRLTKTRTPQ